MALENIFVFKKNTNGSYGYVPASGLLFGLGESGTIVLGDLSNKISGVYNSILGGSDNEFGENTSRSIIGGGQGNCIHFGNANFITAGQGNYISGCANSSNAIIGGCTNVILGNQSIIGGGCGNFLGGGSGQDFTKGASTNVIVGGQYNCAFAVNPFDVSSIYNLLNGWNGVNFNGPIYYNPPSESAVVAGTQNKIGGARSFIGAGQANCAIKNYSVVINGEYNKNQSNVSTIINGEDNYIANGRSNKIDNGCCNRVGICVGQNIFDVSTATQSCYSSIGNGCQNIILTSNHSSIINGKNNAICSSNCSTIGGGEDHCIANTYYATIGGGQSNRAEGSHSFIGGGNANIVLGPSSTIAGGTSNTISINGYHGFIGGGLNNCSSQFSVVAGGNSNRSLGDYASIIGGLDNCITSDGYYATIGGGLANCVDASYGYVIGGRRSKVLAGHDGAGVLGDGQDRDHNSSVPQSLTLDFASGVYIKDRIIAQIPTAPSSYNSAGISGQLAFDNNYFYRHNGTNWTRTAMSIW